MKSITAKLVRSLETGSRLKCADNSGATVLQIIAVKGIHGVARRRPSAGIADMVICAVKKGDPKIRHEVVNAVIVRTAKEYRRPNGLRVAFEDNAAVLVNEKGEPRGTRIKGPIAKEVVERWSAVGKIATMVV
ncbi:MAG: 50S ribosomal protein L14 [Candidatus Aenigmatarchaeota archaeon]|nr:50S ribosomal protein L14 [Candidatus Aenigmarchaeota archaeon]